LQLIDGKQRFYKCRAFKAAESKKRNTTRILTRIKGISPTCVVEASFFGGMVAKPSNAFWA
jgi:hypothetical protein